MNQRVEVSAKDPVRRLVASRWAGSATSDEWRSVGTWLAKVLLMLGMKESRYETPRIDEAAVRFGSEPPDLDWLADPGSVIPQSLSLWVYNCDPDDEQPGLRFPVPRTVVYSDGTAPTVFHTMTVATQGLAATVLSHPGWEIEHPLVEAGEAWELLHAPPQGDGDLSLLPQHGPKGIRWTTFVPLLRGPEETVRMPPLRATDDWPAPQELLDLVEGISF